MNKNVIHLTPNEKNKIKRISKLLKKLKQLYGHPIKINFKNTADKKHN